MKRFSFLLHLPDYVLAAMITFGTFSAVAQETEKGEARPEATAGREPNAERSPVREEERGRPRGRESERGNPERGERREEERSGRVEMPVRGDRENPERNRIEGGDRSRVREEGGEGGPEEKVRHLLEAAEHLEMAGFSNDARKFREIGEHMRAEFQQHRERGGLDEIHRNMKHLQEVVEELQKQNAMLREKVSAMSKTDR